ncbi:MAG: flagellar hook-length control protein FliK [Betaproteobacteria bacterium]|nr:flagellar hook-length control protein FliK [Betaproteobacteria bacterium]MCL2885342.1 flagellar hook-length control protein FliK [Betaproteobacteria bacterium]
MIPPDLAGQLRVTLPPTQQEGPQAIIPAQKLVDVLSNLTAGQRIFAEIQAMLPNGAYRAVVGQRDVTLSLPFSAKAGDSLELEVLESNGKLTLAFVANRTTGQQAAGQPGGQSVATTLSQAGRLIGSLIGRLVGGNVEGSEGGATRAAPAPLNANQPLLKGLPDAAQLAPVLKEALSRSGVFYEAHQARWVAGQLPTEALRQEPQGKTPPTMPPPQQPTDPNAATQPARGEPVLRGEQTPATQPQPAAHSPGAQPTAQSPSTQPAAQQPGMQPGNPIPRELTPIVQQQLDALATQNYAWQGQIWQGQKLWWEISEEADEAKREGDEAGQGWQTRLKLDLPALGGIEARLRLQAGGRIDIQMITDSDESEARLREHLDSLRQSFAAAGLELTGLLVQHGEPA